MCVRVCVLVHVCVHVCACVCVHMCVARVCARTFIEYIFLISSVQWVHLRSTQKGNANKHHFNSNPISDTT